MSGPVAEPLVFTGRCIDCGAHTVPVPTEGPGESWHTATLWVFLAVEAHKPTCLGRPAAGGQLSLLSVEARA